MKPRLAILLIASILLIAAAAVLPAGATGMTQAAAPAPLVGKWSKTISAATWRRHNISYEPAGKWTIAISKKGVLSFYAPGIGFVSTTTILKATRTSVTFSPTADGFCAGNGVYKWKVSGKTLTFANVKDDCDARVVSWTAGSWTRK
jgi:hypothetical protein